MAGPPKFTLGLNPVIDWTSSEYASPVRSLVGYLSDRLGRRVRLASEIDYKAQIAAMRDGRLDAALMGAYAFYRARQEAGAVALVVRVEQGSEAPGSYQSTIFTQVGSPIHTLDDLRGLSIGFVDLDSTAGYLIPRRMLREAGLNVETEMTARFFRTHQAVVEAVLAGEVDAGAVHRRALTGLGDDDPRAAARLHPIATSSPIPTGPIAVRHDLEWDIRRKLLEAFLLIHEDSAASLVVLPPGSRFRPASSRSITLKTVAALAGTSYGTVSRVINNGAHVAPETYDRVMGVIKDLGFRPNAAALSLVANRSDLIGVVAPDTTDPLLARYLAGARRVLSARAMMLVLCHTEGDQDEEARYLELAERGTLAGILLAGESADSPALRTLIAAGFPITLLGAAPGGAPVPTVIPDYDPALSIAADYLRSLGHRTVAVLGPPAFPRILMRYWNAEPDHVGGTSIPLTAHVGAAYEAAHVLLRDPARPTALICGTERIALGALQAAHEVGLAVPGALAVIALGESWLAGASTPSLTTVGFPLEQLGERAAMLLLQQLPDIETMGPLPAIPPPSLVERASTASRQRS